MCRVPFIDTLPTQLITHIRLVIQTPRGRKPSFVFAHFIKRLVTISAFVEI